MKIQANCNQLGTKRNNKNTNKPRWTAFGPACLMIIDDLAFGLTRKQDHYTTTSNSCRLAHDKWRTKVWKPNETKERGQANRRLHSHFEAVQINGTTHQWNTCPQWLGISCVAISLDSINWSTSLLADKTSDNNCCNNNRHDRFPLELVTNWLALRQDTMVCP